MLREKCFVPCSTSKQEVEALAYKECHKGERSSVHAKVACWVDVGGAEVDTYKIEQEIGVSNAACKQAKHYYFGRYILGNGRPMLRMLLHNVFRRFIPGQFDDGEDLYKRTED